MGEVYRARDTRLDRDVALKVLPPAFASDLDRLARFAREAKLLASLNHPGIAHLYGFEQAPLADGSTVHMLVMELVEGEDLTERLKRGPLPVEEAIPIARQVAEALEEAHEKGIVHRDLKPANVKVTADGKVKILDFGLAKAWSVDGERSSSSAPELSQSPTLAHTGTAAGLILGTAAYMSPEQARGKAVDKRADIWAFGVLLFEMLSGRRMFAGETVSDVIAAVLKTEPDWSALPPATTPRLRLLLQRCLERDAKLRLRDIGEARVALAEIAARPGERLPSQAVVAARPVNVVLAVLLALATIALAWAVLARPRPAVTRVVRLSVLPPEKTSFAGIAVSPDGRQLAFTAASGGNVRLWVRALDSAKATPLDGTDGASLPFWSPDARSIGFFAGGKLKRIDAAGGVASTLCDVAVGNGGTWGREGVILFARLGGTGISRVSASGGAVTPVLAVDASRQETDLANPFFLPDGRHFLYDVYSGKKETFGVYVASLDGTLPRRLLDDPSNASYAAAGDAGFLLFARNGALLAQRFDARSLHLEGEPFMIAPHVGASLATVATGVPRRTFSASDNGVVVLDPLVSRQSRRLLWMDRDGRSAEAAGDLEGVGFARLSPDGRHFAVERIDSETANGDIWLCDLNGNASRFTFDPANDAFPTWSGDGSRIVWSSNRDGVYQLYQKSASGSGTDSLLLRSSLFNFPTDWSRDGRTLLYRVVDPKTHYDIWALPYGPEGAGKPFPVLQTEANEAAATLSPDGRWLAYASDESERYEVYVQRFPGGGGKRQVSAAGGLSPQWRSDGGELYYQALDGKLMAVSVERGADFAGSPARPLFAFRPSGPLIGPYYSVAPDGRRFLLSTIVDNAPGAPLTVVLNWAAAAER